MAAKRYMLNRPYIATHVWSVSDNPNIPLKVCKRKFNKGDVIWGEMKHKNNEPCFVAVVGTEGVLVLPIAVVDEVITKDITSSSSADGAEKKENKALAPSTNPKVQYLDAVVLGGIIGGVAVFFAQ